VLLLSLATPPTATHIKTVGIYITNAYMDIWQHFDALLKGGSCCSVKELGDPLDMYFLVKTEQDNHLLRI
jgi:hypothetical protein